MRKFIGLLAALGIVSFANNNLWGLIMARIGISIDPVLDALIQIISIGIALYIVLGSNKDYVKKQAENIYYKLTKGTKFFSHKEVSTTIIIVSLIGMAVFAANFSVLVADSANRQMARNLDNYNSLIVATVNPDYKKTEREFPYGLLVEFRSKDATANLSLVTTNGFKTYEAEIGKPSQKTIALTDEQAIRQRRIANGQVSTFTFGMADKPPTVARTDNSLVYIAPNTLITSTASFYIYLEGDKPLQVLSANFDGKLFRLVGGKLLPQ